MGAQLMIGLGGIGNPYEWEWAYTNIVLLAIVMLLSPLWTFARKTLRSREYSQAK